MGDEPNNITINAKEIENENNNSTMDQRSNWDQDYEEGFGSHLNELGVPQAVYEGLARNWEFMRGIAMATWINVPQEFIERGLQGTARFVVCRMHKYVRNHSCREISASIDHLNRRYWMISYKCE